MERKQLRFTEKIDLASTKLADALVDHRRILVGVVIAATVILAFCLPRLETDPGLKSGMDAAAPAYQQYRKFVELFGDEEYFLVAVKSDKGALDPKVLEGLELVTTSLGKDDKVAEVISLSNLRVFQRRKDLLGTYPVVRNTNGHRSLPEPSDLEAIREALPVTDLLLSSDLKTVGILVKPHEKWKFDVDTTKHLLDKVGALVKENFPPGFDQRTIGVPVIRQAILRYNAETAVIFGILCTLICTAITIYLFRSVRVTAITDIILAVCVIWVLGLMAVLGVPINSTTCLAFGMVPITTLETVIHMVARFNRYRQTEPNRVEAARQTVRLLTRPCLFCALTTAVGFGTCMVSSIPMVFQLGLVMSLGLIISFALAMILTPAFLVSMKSLDTSAYKAGGEDWLSRVLAKTRHSVFRYPKPLAASGFVLIAIFFSGAPLMHSDPQILRMLSDSAQEVKDIHFVEHNLTAVTSLELVIEAQDQAFKKADAWKQLEEMENRVSEVPHVTSLDSYLPFLKYMNALIQGPEPPKTDLFANAKLIPQLLHLTSMSPEGKRIGQRFLDENFDKLHISVRFKNSPTTPIGDTIEQVREAAATVMNCIARVTVTGELAVVAAQAADLVSSQIYSMFLALTIITVLTMIQMGSPLLGLISLIPNVLPIAAVFGVMGFFGISLDSVTVFAATVAVGLAVDNTIHFMTQLKHEMKVNPGLGIEECLARAYRLATRPMASWSIVTFFGFLALVVSPFRPVVFFGVLGCSSILLGLFGDLVFLQALILTSPTIRKAIQEGIDRENGTEPAVAPICG